MSMSQSCASKLYYDLKGWFDFGVGVPVTEGAKDAAAAEVWLCWNMWIRMRSGSSDGTVLA